MRTKALLLTAALSAAGVATSMAQAVYSQNAVGYVNTVLKPGFNLISNPLKATDNSISALFAGVPPNTTVFKYNGVSGYKSANMDPDDLVFTPPDAAAQTVLPGEGVFVKNPKSTDLTITFVGEVMQGTDLQTDLPQGLSIRSSQVPQSGTAADLKLVGQPNDTIFQYVNDGTATPGYYSSTFDPDDLVWNPPLKPLRVGEAFFIKKAKADVWHRQFDVNAG